MFTLTKLVDKVREIVDERPKVFYTQTKCYYLNGVCSDGTTGCLFGQALLALGVEPSILLAHNEEFIVNLIDNLTDNLTNNLTDNSEQKNDEKLMFWCGCVQENQDKKISWKKCVELADIELEKYDIEGRI